MTAEAPGDAPLLTSNDLARAAMGVGLAISWFQKRPASGFNRKEIAKFKVLLDKLDAAGDHNNPYLINYDDMPLDWGDDPIYGPLPAKVTP